MKKVKSPVQLIKERWAKKRLPTSEQAKGDIETLLDEIDSLEMQILHLENDIESIKFDHECDMDDMVDTMREHGVGGY